MSIAPGIESWSGYVAKVGVTRRTGGEKVERLVEHFTQLHEVVPYLQANFLFGLGHSLSDISSARAPPAPLPRPFAAAQSSEIERIVVNLPYPLICALVGFVVGWIPMFFHGPIPEKFNLFGIRGAIAVWTWYAARLLIGVMVGISSQPRRWYLRGPLCGFLMLLPPGIMSLATPTCGPVCMFWNETTGTIAGLLIAGIAFLVTGRHHGLDEPDPAPR